MTKDAMEQRWKSSGLQPNGRPGQAQNGVDIYGTDDIGRWVGIQCKRYATALDLKTVEDEVKNAEQFQGHLTTLFVATTTPYDSTLQQQVRLMSHNRTAQGKFSVGLLFWKDIVDGLIQNPAIFNAHYPNISLEKSAFSNKERLLAALELGYYGADFWVYIDLVFGEYGEMAQEDPDQIATAISVMEIGAKQLFSPDMSGPILASLTAIKQIFSPTKVEGFSWMNIKVKAKRLSRRIVKSGSGLSLIESNVLDISVRLGLIYHHADDLPTQAVRDQLKQAVSTVLPASSAARVSETFEAASNLKSGDEFARKIYGLMEQEIRYG